MTTNATISPDQYPTLLGSLTSLSVDVLGSGSGFEIGNFVDVTSSRGEGAVARVANVISETGLVSFSLVDGGYGYTENSEVLISEVILSFSGANSTNQPLALFANVYQDVANIAVTGMTGGAFANGQNVISYNGDNSVNGIGIVIQESFDSETTGWILVNVLSGNLQQGNAIYIDGNTVSANLAGYSNVMATGNLMGWFDSNTDQLKLGLKDINNQFYQDFLVLSSGGFSNTLTAISNGSGANVGIYPFLLYQETIPFNTDTISPYVGVALNATAYGFPGDPAANGQTIIQDALTYEDVTFGRIQLLIDQNPGDGYTEAPIVRVYEPLSFVWQIHDTIELELDGLSSAFQNGEVVEQTGSNGRGLIISANLTTLVLKRLRSQPFDDFVVGLEITGASSNAMANVINFTVWTNSDFIGLDCQINAAVSVLSGAVNKLDVVDSGFGFQDFDIVDFSNSEIEGSTTGTAVARVTTSGKGLGFYEQIGGFASDRKKLFDGHYWQYFSYDVIAPMQLAEYAQLLKQVIHTAGYALFGTYEQVANDSIGIVSATEAEWSYETYNPLGDLILDSTGYTGIMLGNDTLSGNVYFAVLLGDVTLYSIDTDLGSGLSITSNSYHSLMLDTIGITGTGTVT